MLLIGCGCLGVGVANRVFPACQAEGSAAARAETTRNICGDSELHQVDAVCSSPARVLQRVARSAWTHQWKRRREYYHPAGKPDVMHSMYMSVCLSVCVQDYFNSNQLILLKLGTVIGPGLPVGTTGQVLVVMRSRICIPDQFSTFLGSAE